MHKHEKLGLTLAEYGALLAVRKLLHSGDIVQTHAEVAENGAHGFTMSVIWDTTPHDGTLGDIAGYMGYIMGMSSAQVHGWAALYSPTNHSRGSLRDAPLAELFYPPAEYAWDHISASQAVVAIDSFLAYGEPRWELILSPLVFQAAQAA